MIDIFASALVRDEIAEFCHRWHIQELALFGSALRDDFQSNSDLDLIATFDTDANWSLLDHVQMQLELEGLLGRPVDLISRRALEQSQNWLLRKEILTTAQILFRSGEAHDAAG